MQSGGAYSSVLTVLPGRQSPFLALQLSCPEINDETLGKIRETLS